MQQVAGLTATQADGVLSLADCQGNSSEILDNLQPRISASEAGVEGVEQLRELFQACARAGIPDNRVTLDPTIARGLDYYTGTIYETYLDALPGIGSVCSGGRYDDLAELFTSQPLPGVGASLGLDRLLAAMEELHLTAADTSTAPVLVTFFDATRSLDYLTIARRLRTEGIACEVFPDARPLGKQLKYADRKGFRVAVIAGADEFDEGAWQIKDLRDGERHRASDDNLASTILDILG